MRPARFKSRAAAAVLGLGAGCAAIAVAQHETVIQNRIASFREMGTALKHIRDQLQLERPDLSLIRSSAELIQERGAHMLDWFPPGSEPPPQKGWIERLLDWFSSDDMTPMVGADAKSHAKHAIWSERAQFEAAFRKFEAHAATLRQTAQQGQLSALRPQLERLQQTCEGCHDGYRDKLD